MTGPGPGGRILVVEDTPHNLELMTYLLAAHGHLVIPAVSGEECLDVACAARPDLVVMDLQLPGIDGYQTMRTLRTMPELTRVPIVAVTSFAMVGDRDRALGAGFEDYFTKPIDPESFAAAIGGFLPEHSRGCRPTPTVAKVAVGDRPEPDRAPQESADILVLDDSATNQTLLRSMLEPHGYRLRAVFTVEEAIASALETCPDLFLSDIHVGPQRGSELLAACEAVPELAAVPFAFITATVDAPETLGSRGAVRVICRPIDPAALLDEVRDLLKSQAGV